MDVLYCFSVVGGLNMCPRGLVLLSLGVLPGGMQAGDGQYVARMPTICLPGHRSGFVACLYTCRHLVWLVLKWWKMKEMCD